MIVSHHHERMQNDARAVGSTAPAYLYEQRKFDGMHALEESPQDGTQ